MIALRAGEKQPQQPGSTVPESQPSGAKRPQKSRETTAKQPEEIESTSPEKKGGKSQRMLKIVPQDGQITDLEEQNGQASKPAKRSTTAKLQARIAELEREIEAGRTAKEAELEQQLEALKKRFQTYVDRGIEGNQARMEQSRRIIELEQENAAFKQSLETLKALVNKRLHKGQDYAQQMIEQEQQLSALKAENAELIERIAALEGIMHGEEVVALAHPSPKDKEIAQLKYLLDGDAALIRKLEAKSATQAEQIVQLERENADQAERITAQEKQRAELQATLEQERQERTHENTTHATFMGELGKRLDASEKKVKQKSAYIDAQKTWVHQYKQSDLVLRDQLEQAQTENATQAERITAKDKQIEQLQAEKAALVEQNQLMASHIMEQEQHCQRLIEEKAASDNENASLKEQIEANQPTDEIRINRNEEYNEQLVALTIREGLVSDEEEIKQILQNQANSYQRLETTTHPSNTGKTDREPRGTDREPRGTDPEPGQVDQEPARTNRQPHESSRESKSAYREASGAHSNVQELSREIEASQPIADLRINRNEEYNDGQVVELTIRGELTHDEEEIQQNIQSEAINRQTATTTDAITINPKNRAHHRRGKDAATGRDDAKGYGMEHSGNQNAPIRASKIQSGSGISGTPDENNRASECARDICGTTNDGYHETEIKTLGVPELLQVTDTELAKPGKRTARESQLENLLRAFYTHFLDLQARFEMEIKASGKKQEFIHWLDQILAITMPTESTKTLTIRFALNGWFENEPLTSTERHTDYEYLATRTGNSPNTMSKAAKRLEAANIIQIRPQDVLDENGEKIGTQTYTTLNPIFKLPKMFQFEKKKHGGARRKGCKNEACPTRNEADERFDPEHETHKFSLEYCEVCQTAMIDSLPGLKNEAKGSLVIQAIREGRVAPTQRLLNLTGEKQDAFTLVSQESSSQVESQKQDAFQVDQAVDQFNQADQQKQDAFDPQDEQQFTQARDERIKLARSLLEKMYMHGYELTFSTEDSSLEIKVPSGDWDNEPRRTAIRNKVIDLKEELYEILPAFLQARSYAQAYAHIDRWEQEKHQKRAQQAESQTVERNPETASQAAMF